MRRRGENGEDGRWEGAGGAASSCLRLSCSARADVIDGGAWRVGSERVQVRYRQARLLFFIVHIYMGHGGGALVKEIA